MGELKVLFLFTLLLLHNMKCSLIYTSFFLALPFFSVSAQQGAQEPKRPNIIIYLSDDQNSWDFQTFGNTQVDTSHFDRLAREGMTFSNAYTAQAICAPSRSQLFTGLFPMRNGCMANHLPVKNVTDINDYFNAIGYEVILAGKGHIKPSSVFNWTHFYHTVKNRLLPINKVKKYIQDSSKPFCIIFASDLPHGPYPAQNDYVDKPLDYDPTAKNPNIKIARSKSGYYQNIADDNAQLGQVLSMLENLFVLDSSLFLYLSDHGLKGKWSVRETGLKVPMVARWPNRIKPKTQSNQFVALVDILPTILEIAGGSVPDDIDGISFLPILEGKENKIRDYVYGIATRQNIQSCYVFPSRSVRNQRYKYVRNFNSLEVVEQNLSSNQAVNAFIKRGAEAFPKVPFEELYDLEKDPFEHINLIQNKEYAVIKNQLENQLIHWMTQQNDFLIDNKMPLLKPTLHPIDRISKWNKPPKALVGSLKKEDYLSLHY
ncbi:MAG: Choline-sulfatase [Flavobacteriales bacterium]|nr:MAG: Choline-sulfatase [Flavobacteriales bacterium]